MKEARNWDRDSSELDVFMTGNMSKSIKYCGNQFDVATLLYATGEGTTRTGPGYGFIYCRTPHSTQGYKTYTNVLVRCDGCCYCSAVFGTTAGCTGGLQRQVSDKNEKRYVNFVGTDVKIKPFIWNSTMGFCFFFRFVSFRLDGKYMTLWAKLEIYLFTHGFDAVRLG